MHYACIISALPIRTATFNKKPVVGRERAAQLASDSHHHRCQTTGPQSGARLLARELAILRCLFGTWSIAREGRCIASNPRLLKTSGDLEWTNH